MTFSTNLQALRHQRNMSQEQMAMLLGVSRQSISKWEGEKAYPEMDKLLIICDLFECTLDDLVLGDVSRPGSGTIPRSADDPSQNDMPHADAPVQDATGYDQQMRAFAGNIALGVGAIILGVAVGMLFDGNASVLGVNPLNEALLTLCVFIGVVAGLALIIPASLSHESFKRQHPFVVDFYTEEEREADRKSFALTLVSGIGIIVLSTVIPVACESLTGHDSDGWPLTLFLACVAAGVTIIIHGSLMHRRMDIDSYNEENDESETHSADGSRKQTIQNAVCGSIMLLATILALLSMFGVWSIGNQELFWVYWPVGGLLCGMASLIIDAIMPSSQ